MKPPTSAVRPLGSSEPYISSSEPMPIVPGIDIGSSSPSTAFQPALSETISSAAAS